MCTHSTSSRCGARKRWRRSGTRAWSPRGRAKVDQFLTALISPIALFLGGVVISGFGVALGAAARYGLPTSYRYGGGWTLAGLSTALMVAVVAGAAINEPARAGWLYLVSFL